MRQHVAVEVVHIHHWNPQPQRHPFGEACAYQQGAYQAGAAGEGYGRELCRRYAGPAQCGVDHRHDVLLVRARCQFGHHAAVFLVHALRGNDIAAQYAVDNYRGRSVVAARFYAKDGCGFVFHLLFFRIRT